MGGKYGCLRCSGKEKWTLDKFLIKAKEIHGNNFDYSEIKDIDIERVKSKVKITCNLCKYVWNPTIGNHINKKYGCPYCSNNAPWTIERFLIEANEIHGNKFDYSKIFQHDIKGKDSRILLTCLECKYSWETTIHSHITGKTGCPLCKKVAPWTLERFLSQARIIHGDNYDYSEITVDHIRGVHSNIPIKCLTCNYKWNPQLNDHINSKSGCPLCSKQAPWTMEKLLIMGTTIHGDKYDYSLTKASEVREKYSRITILCKSCQYQWRVSISNHIHKKNNCPNCARVAPLTVQTFVSRSSEIHQNIYDYSKIPSDSIINVKSKVPLVCTICMWEWQATVGDHLYHKTGCPKCNFSKGEKECIKFLESININYKPQYQLKSLPCRYFDIKYSYSGKRYLIEFDGKQHFEDISFFNKDGKGLNHRQDVDIIKTKAALDSGFNIIRIDYTQINNVGKHIVDGMNSDNNLYLSNVDFYKYIIDNV